MNIINKIDDIVNLTEKTMVKSVKKNDWKQFERLLKKDLDKKQRDSVFDLMVKRSGEKGDPEQRAMTLARQLEKGNWLRVSFKNAKEVLTSIFRKE